MDEGFGQGLDLFARILYLLSIHLERWRREVWLKLVPANELGEVAVGSVRVDPVSPAVPLGGPDDPLYLLFWTVVMKARPLLVAAGLRTIGCPPVCGLSDWPVDLAGRLDGVLEAFPHCLYVLFQVGPRLGDGLQVG